MNSDRSADYSCPDIFSRGALELTFRLLRADEPALALQVQNVLASEKIPDGSHENPANDHYYVNLEARTVGKIIAALTELGLQALREGETTEGLRLVISALIREWMNLAEWIIIQAYEGVSASH